MQMFVRSSVCLMKTCMSRALSLHLLGSDQVSLWSLLGLSPQVSLFSHSALLEYFVGKTEPKILRLV